MLIHQTLDTIHAIAAALALWTIGAALLTTLAVVAITGAVTGLWHHHHDETQLLDDTTPTDYDTAA